jgi:hypothetical protein
LLQVVGAYAAKDCVLDALCWGYFAAVLKSALASSHLLQLLKTAGLPHFSLAKANSVFACDSWGALAKRPDYIAEHGKLNGNGMESKGIRFVIFGKCGKAQKYTKGKPRCYLLCMLCVLRCARACVLMPTQCCCSVCDLMALCACAHCLQLRYGL